MGFKDRKRARELSATIERGTTLFMAQDENALEFIEDAAQRFPASAEIRLLFASALLPARPDEVVAQAAKAAELGVRDPVIQVRAGDLLLSEGDLEGARACAARAEELADGEFILLADLEGLSGRVAARGRNYPLAEEKLRLALLREPEWSSHTAHLARFLWARGRRDEALAVIDESLERVRDKDHLERLRSEIAADTPS